MSIILTTFEGEDVALISPSKVGVLPPRNVDCIWLAGGTQEPRATDDEQEVFPAILKSYHSTGILPHGGPVRVSGLHFIPLQGEGVQAVNSVVPAHIMATVAAKVVYVSAEGTASIAPHLSQPSIRNIHSKCIRDLHKA